MSKHSNDVQARVGWSGGTTREDKSLYFLQCLPLWVSHRDESLRIVSEAVFEQVDARMRAHVNNDKRFKAGGKSKYLLSGLMYCESCGANYVLGDREKYVCSSYIHGRACSNDIRVRKDTAETVVLSRVREQLSEPSRVKAMVSEIQRCLTQQLKERAARSVEAPQELKELDARLARLHGRFRDGDPDMAPDELQLAIDRVEVKRRQLLAGLHDGTDIARFLSTVPKAAELYEERLALGLQGDQAACEEARIILRSLIPDRIRLSK